jgi:hypothetical protein
MPKLNPSALPPHPLVALADLARFHEREFASNTGKSYARDSAHDHLHASALLMAFFELFDDIELDDADHAKLRDGYEMFLTKIALMHGKEETD